MTRLFFEMNKHDLDVRTPNEGCIPLSPLGCPMNCALEAK
jgi:hypothetical protein